MLHYKAVARNLTWKIADVVLIIFGLSVMVYTTTLTLKSWVSGDEQPGYVNNTSISTHSLDKQVAFCSCLVT